MATATRTNTYAELTEAEKREVCDRGFPRGRGVRYVVRSDYRYGEWMLVRFVRVEA